MYGTIRTRMRCLFQVFASGFRVGARMYLAILGASTESCLGCASDVRVMKHFGRRCAGLLHPALLRHDRNGLLAS